MIKHEPLEFLTFQLLGIQVIDASLQMSRGPDNCCEHLNCLEPPEENWIKKDLLPAPHPLL
jgi:hypothetical protein